MKIEIDGQPGIKIEVVGYPWNKAKFGPPYLRMETSDGKYLISPKYKELLKLQKMVNLCVRCEREVDTRKRVRSRSLK